MLKVLMFTVSVLAFPAMVFAQDTAALDTEAPSDAAEVVAICEATADGDEDLAGSCLTAAQDFLDANGESSDEDVADLVVALVTAAQGDEACNALDSEVASAVQMASTRVSDPQQATRLEEISESVGACEDSDTSAVVVNPPVIQQGSPA